MPQADLPPAYSVPPVERAFALLRHIAGGGTCANVSHTAKALGINRTTLIRLLHTLQAEAMIEPAEGNGWRLGPGLIALAGDALVGRDITRLARPVMQALSEKLKLSSHLGILDRREIIYVVREAPNAHLVSNVREGTRLPAHATTVGRILLAFLPGEALDRLYEGERLPAYSDKTSTSLRALKDQIARDRAQGFAWSAGNFETGIGSCAVPVLDHDGTVRAALNVTGPVDRFVQDSPEGRTIVAALQEASEAISRSLGRRPEVTG